MRKTKALRNAVVGTALAVAASVALAPSANAGASGVVFGSLVATNTGESLAQAVAREDATFGTLPVSRIFYTGAVQQWPGKAGLSGRPVVVSFKYTPSLVLTGQYDTALTQFFAGAPRNYAVYWSYIHEPEDNIAKAEFTAADYRSAWEHIADLAAVAAPTHPLMRSTLILMCYTLNSASGRDWRNYYVSTAQSMIAFDCYNHAGKQGTYGDPANIFKPITDWQVTPAAQGITWGISEVGSTLGGTDTDGAKRAAWLRSVGTFLVNQHAVNPNHSIFGIYFDSAGGGNATDYRLLDANSQAAWREVVQTY